jgi:phosphate/sulfate permease
VLLFDIYTNLLPRIHTIHAYSHRFTLTLSIGVLGWWQALLLSVGAGSVALLVFVCCIYPSLRAYIFRTMSTKVFDQHGRLVDVPPEIELRVIERDDDELEPRSQNGGHMGGGKHIRGDNVAAGASATVNPTQAEWYHTPQPPARIGTDYRDYEPESYEEEGRLVVLDNPLQRHLARQMDVFDYLDPVETEYECADCHSRQLYKVGTAKVMIIKNKIDALWELKESGMPLRSRVAVIKLKRMFGHVQILTTTIKSFAHGSNDVSNSIAPLAGIYVLYTSGAVGDPTTEGLPLWLLAIGGCGISVGLFFGRRVIKTVGAEIAPLTPST